MSQKMFQKLNKNRPHFFRRCDHHKKYQDVVLEFVRKIVEKLKNSGVETDNLPVWSNSNSDIDIEDVSTSAVLTGAENSNNTTPPEHSEKLRAQVQKILHVVSMLLDNYADPNFIKRWSEHVVNPQYKGDEGDPRDSDYVPSVLCVRRLASVLSLVFRTREVTELGKSCFLGPLILTVSDHYQFFLTGSSPKY